MSVAIKGNSLSISFDTNEHYFDKAFEPILVAGDDCNEYKVIPSDQFK